MITGIFFVQQGGETALMYAAKAGRQECVSILVANGADVNVATNKVGIWDAINMPKLKSITVICRPGP